MSCAPGTRLGPYEILDHLGSGGMGEVYRAKDTRLGRTVAIKMLHGAHNDRFEREARAIAALNHPHICTLHDIGPNYLVMEYVEGPPLKGPLKPAEALRLAVQIAQALEAAHRKGIIHRDLKPANILVTGAGVKLLDFGLAKLQQENQPAEETVTQTQAGTILGTAAYMSPELEKAWQHFRSRSFVILGMGDDRETEKVRAVLNKAGVTYPQSAGPTGYDLVHKRFRVDRFPTKVLLDPAGRILALDNDGSMDAENLGATLDKLLRAQ